MVTTRLSLNDQVTLPKAVLDELGWEPGLIFAVETVPDGVWLRPVQRTPATRLEDVFGRLAGYGTGRVRTLAEMDSAIDEELAARNARGGY